jgi:hypothetical protein
MVYGFSAEAIIIDVELLEEVLRDKDEFAGLTRPE